MINAEVARVLDRIADLLEISGGDTFRISSYRRAARSVRDATEDLARLVDEHRLTDLPGVGKGTAERIQTFLNTGHIDVLDELERKFPKGLTDLLEIPGLGPKKVAAAYETLGVAGIADLKRVIASGELAALPGFGDTSVKKIADGLAFLESSGDRTPLGVAMPIAEALLERVRGLRGVARAELAGSLRRGVETIGDIDILCDARDGAAVVKQFTSFSNVKRVLAAGDTKGSITVERDDGRELQIDLRVVPTGSFGAAWQYFTGSKNHNVRVRERAVRKKWKLNEYGLFDGDTLIAGRTEEEIYRKLGLRWMPPEVREDRGELDVESWDGLVTLDGIRGDLHMHTTASDGKCSIEEMARAAQKLGYAYVAICDHSPSATIANGLSIPRMKKHIREIRAVEQRIKGITVLVGCECDILPDGRLDYPDEVLAECDWVVASIHLAMGSAGGARKHSATERTIAAMQNRFVSAIGHPSGRLINRRAPMELDWSAVIDAAKKSQTMLEINASWQRLDLKDLHVRQAVEAGVMLTINTDAHHTDQLGQMRFGVTTARRGWAQVKDVANCLTLAALKKRIARKRSG